MRKDVIEKVAQLMTAAFGLVAALAWNGAIQALFAQLFGTSSQLAAMFAYAIIITIVAVIAAIWIGRVADRAR